MLIRYLATAFLFAAAAFAASKASPKVTFNQDVLPVLQERCQNCHRAGEVAPMPLLSYEETRPWASAIKEAVLLKRMPPWFADPHASKTFSNDRSLSKQEIETIVAWVDAGAPEGDSEARPEAVAFVDGWNIGEPDVSFEMQQEFAVPAEGVIDYQYLVIPTGFTEDKWVERAEIRPGNRAVLHHVIVFVRPPDSTYMGEAKPGEFFVPGSYDERKQKQKQKQKRNDKRDFLIGFAPGTVPEELEPGQAKLIPAGSDFVLQLHYTPNGKATTDKSYFGLVFAEQPPRERVVTMAVSTEDFVIPPGAPNHRVDAEMKVKNDMTLTALLPHMHLRGKAFEYRVIFPDGRKETLLSVPRYDFNWQLSYYLEEPLFLPKGAKLECTAWYDNSPNNPANPDPAKEVRYGDQSWEEMMFGFFDASFPVEDDKQEKAGAE
jgi:hypothetical protein